MTTRTLSLAAALWFIAASVAAAGQKPNLPAGSGRGAGPWATAQKPSPPGQHDPKATPQDRKELLKQHEHNVARKHEILKDRMEQKHQNAPGQHLPKPDVKPPAKPHPPAGNKPVAANHPGKAPPGGARPAGGKGR